MVNNQFFRKLQDENQVLEALKKEEESIGYYSLPEQDIDKIEKFSQTINKKHIVIIGIGGSSLGTKAVYDFLRYKNSFDKKLYFCESTDPVLLNSTFSDLDLKEMCIRDSCNIKW